MKATTFDLRGKTLTRDAADLLLGFSREVIALIASREGAESSSYTQGEEDCLPQRRGCSAPCISIESLSAGGRFEACLVAS